MSALSNRRCAIACAVLASIAFSAGCSIERIPHASGCVQGRSEACTCADGSPGASVCAAEGVFGACQCAALSPGGQGGVAAPPPTAAAGIGGGGGGGGGTAGAGAGADPSVAAGSEAPPIADAGEAVRDAMTHAEDAAIDASPAEDAAIPEPPEPDPGELYGPCGAGGTCGANLFCTIDPLTAATTYCTTFCSVAGLGPMCPKQASGEPGTCVSNVCMR